MATLQKKHLYQVFNGSTYLGLIPNVVSSFAFNQDMNTAGSQIVIETAVTPDVSSLANATIDDETGTPLQAEDGTSLLTERSTDIVGSSDPTILIRNGNTVKVYEYSDNYPNGKLMFSGVINKWEAGFKGVGGSDTVKITVYSDGQDLDNYLIAGTSTLDQSQTSQNNSLLIYEDTKGGIWQRAGQTWTAGNSTPNISAIKVKLALASAGFPQTCTLAIWTAADGFQHSIASTTQTVTSTTPQDYTFTFTVPITATPGLQYSFAVYGQDSHGVYIYYQGSDVYSGGDMYESAYAGGSGGGGWVVTPTGSILSKSDLYFQTYFTGTSTNSPFNNQDPGTIVTSVIDAYVSRGGKINYSAGTVDTVGANVSYTFITATILEGIKKSLDLAGSGYYWYVDVGTDTLYFKKTSQTAKYTLIKGKHIEELEIIASIENIVNTVYFTGGLVGTTNLFSTYTDPTSIASFGQRIDRQSDNRVTIQGTADTLGNGEVATSKNEQYQTTVTISDQTMDITLLKPGDTIGFSGFGTFVDNLITQIIRLEYSSEEVKLTLGIFPKRTIPEFEKLKRGLIALQTVANP